MISRVFNKAFFFSILMVLVGLAFSLTNKSGSDNFIEMWEIKINTNNGGVAIMIVGAGIFMMSLFKVFDFHKNLPADSLLRQNFVLIDKDSGKGVSGANIKINFQEGPKIYTSDPSGYVHIEYQHQNKTYLKFAEMEVVAEGYDFLSNYRLSLTDDKGLQKVLLVKSKASPVNKESKPKSKALVRENNLKTNEWTELLKKLSTKTLQDFVDKFSDDLSYATKTELNLLLAKYKYRQAGCDEASLRKELTAFVQKLDGKK